MRVSPRAPCQSQLRLAESAALSQRGDQAWHVFPAGVDQGCRRRQLQDVVGAVAERLVVRALAPAKIKGPGTLRHEAQRLEGGGLVGAVAKGLLGGAAAGAPEISFSGLEGHLIRAFLRADGLVGHGSLP